MLDMPMHRAVTDSFALSGVAPSLAAGRGAEAAAHPFEQSVSFELVTTRAAFDALEDEWNDLFARAGRSAQIFQTFNWNWHWANH